MKDVLEFIIQNYQFFLTIFVLLLTFFVSIFRKKIKVSDDTLGRVITTLPMLICEVEKSMKAEKCGTSKKARVMDLALDVYKHLTGVELTYDSFIANQISNAIEDILATPQKKGD